MDEEKLGFAKKGCSAGAVQTGEQTFPFILPERVNPQG
jgi:hypothetical protein